jgi:hypothetical protein
MLSGGASTQAMVENRIALDGLAPVQDYSQTLEGRTTLSGHGVLRWDPAEAHYLFHRFDSGGGHPVAFRGHFKDDPLALEAHTAQGHPRASWQFPEPGRHHDEMQGSQDGCVWFPFMGWDCRRT